MRISMRITTEGESPDGERFEMLEPCHDSSIEGLI